VLLRTPLRSTALAERTQTSFFRHATAAHTLRVVRLRADAGEVVSDVLRDVVTLVAARAIEDTSDAPPLPRPPPAPCRGSAWARAW
jgi:hypothetical protein